MNDIAPAANVLSEPATTSRARSGNRAQILPNSETCSMFSVPERIEVAIRKLELFDSNSSSEESLRGARTLRSCSGRFSYGNFTLSRKRPLAEGRSCATVPARTLELKTHRSSINSDTNVDTPSCRAFKMIF